MFGIFKSKEEKEQKKALDAEAKMIQEIGEYDRISDARSKRDAVEHARDFQKELDVQYRFAKAGASLETIEREIRAALIVALNDLKQENNRKNPNSVDVERCKQSVKNYVFKLHVIRRAKKALDYSRKNHQWERGMTELSNTFKLMNEIRSGSSFIKRLVFLFRYNKVNHIEDDVKNQVKKYFGSKAQEISDEDYDRIIKSDLIDIMVSDEIFDVLTDSSQIDTCIDDPNIMKCSTDELIKDATEVKKMLEKDGEQPVTEIGNDRILSDDEVQDILRK